MYITGRNDCLVLTNATGMDASCYATIDGDNFALLGDNLGRCGSTLGQNEKSGYCKIHAQCWVSKDTVFAWLLDTE